MQVTIEERSTGSGDRCSCFELVPETVQEAGLLLRLHANAKAAPPTLSVDVANAGTIRATLWMQHRADFSSFLPGTLRKWRTR